MSETSLDVAPADTSLDMSTDTVPPADAMGETSIDMAPADTSPDTPADPCEETCAGLDCGAVGECDCGDCLGGGVCLKGACCQPSDEVCDGIDNDCDTEIDEVEPGQSLCDDGVDCTVDTCAGVEECVSTPDDDACYDQNECTVDSCAPDTGCDSSPVDDDTPCGVDEHWSCQQGTCTCAPDTCDTLGYGCGECDDGCGDTLDCGGCEPGTFCGDNACLVPTCEDPVVLGCGDSFQGNTALGEDLLDETTTALTRCSTTAPMRSTCWTSLRACPRLLPLPG